MEQKEKNKPINLTDALVRDLKPRDKDYFISDKTPGLRLRVWTSGEKVWYFVYRPKGKNPQKLKLDNFKKLSVRGARTRCKRNVQQIVKNVGCRKTHEKLCNETHIGNEPFK